MPDLTRREWLALLGAAGAGAALPPGAFADGGETSPRTIPAATAAPIIPHTSATGVYLPPRGDALMKWSFDTPEPSVAFAGLEFGFKLFGRENVFFPDQSRMSAEERDGGLRLGVTGFLTAGGQLPAPGSLTATFRRSGDWIEWDTTVELPVPVKSVATIIRGIPRGKISAGGGGSFDPKDNELLFGYPFSGGDLFGGNAAQGLGTPLLIVESGEQAFHFVSSLDSRVRTKRFYLQPGEQGYRIEAIHEVEGWLTQSRVTVPRWRIGTAESLELAAQPHYEHLERAYRFPSWETRSDVPDWLRKTSLVLALHGMHYSGYVFNSFDAMGEILRAVAAEMPPERVLVFLPAWDGRYYWNYPEYQPDARLGGPAGLRRLIADGKAAGFRFMPMFGANAANRRMPSFSRFADAVTRKIDGDVMDLNWVDWDNDRHQEGWGAYMNLGVESWRRWLADRIAETIERYEVDAYFLDIIGGWANNTTADMHEGARRLVADLRRRHPGVLACGEFHYDALAEFIPLYHVYSPRYLKYARYFSHLSHPAPGRGSSGVHESGFSPFDPATLSIPERPGLIPTLTVVDDTFTTYRDQALAVVREARRRSDAR
jgi:hypothetical protein